MSVDEYTNTERLQDSIASLYVSRRERIATACLAGMLAEPDGDGSMALVRVAVAYADALIAELDRE